jgi:hypothetical protein
MDPILALLQGYTQYAIVDGTLYIRAPAKTKRK